MKKTQYVYFLYSEDQYQEKNKILNTMGKRFQPGTVVVNGTRQKFTAISTKNTLARFVDTKVIAEGILGDFIYTETAKRPIDL